MKPIRILGYWARYLTQHVALYPLVLTVVVLLLLHGTRFELSDALPALLVGMVLQGRATWIAVAHGKMRRRYQRVVGLAVAAQRVGQLDEAEQLVRNGVKALDSLHATYLNSILPGILLRRGALDEALALQEAHKKSHGDRTGELRTQTGVSNAALLALAGNTDGATLMLDWFVKSAELFGLLAANEPKRQRVAALIHIRRGEHAQAIALLDRHAEMIAQGSTLEEMRITWLLRAFAEHAVSSPRDTGASERWLSLARQSSSSPLGFYAVKWPELRTFMQANGLA